MAAEIFQVLQDEALKQRVLCVEGFGLPTLPQVGDSFDKWYDEPRDCQNSIRVPSPQIGGLALCSQPFDGEDWGVSNLPSLGEVPNEIEYLQQCLSDVFYTIVHHTYEVDAATAISLGQSPANYSDDQGGPLPWTASTIVRPSGTFDPRDGYQQNVFFHITRIFNKQGDAYTRLERVSPEDHVIYEESPSGLTWQQFIEFAPSIFGAPLPNNEGDVLTCEFSGFVGHYELNVPGAVQMCAVEVPFPTIPMPIYCVNGNGYTRNDVTDEICSYGDYVCRMQLTGAPPPAPGERPGFVYPTPGETEYINWSFPTFERVTHLQNYSFGVPGVTLIRRK